MKLAIIIPTLTNVEGLKILKKQIKLYTGKEYQVFVIKGTNGVARAWNDGLKKAIEAGCTHFAIFNDDIELCPHWWEKCQEKFNSDIHLLSLGKINDFLIFTGWFFILDKTAIDRVGFFDEQFTLTSEDADYSIRYKKSGLKYGTIDLPIKHHGSATIKKLDRDRFKEKWNENWLRLRAKYPDIKFQDQLK